MQGRVLVCLAEYFKAYETQFSCYHVHDPLSLESVKSTLGLFRTGRTDAKGLSLCVLCLIWGLNSFLKIILSFMPMKGYGLDDATFYTQNFQSYKNSLSNFTVEDRLSQACYHTTISTEN